MDAPTDVSPAAFEWPPDSAIDPTIERDAAAFLAAALPTQSTVDKKQVDSDAATLLTDVQRAMLDFERQWWRQPGAKEQAIRDTFAMSPTRYYQTLNALLDLPGAVGYDAPLVHRLQRLRSSAVRSRRLA